MNTNVKKILLTGTALMAVSMIGSGAANAQQHISANGQTVTTGTAGAGVNFQGNFTANNGGVNTAIGNAVTTAGGGTLDFTGGAANTIAGAVGALNTVGISGGAALTLTNTAFGATNLTYTGAGTTNFAAGTNTATAIGFGANAGIVNFGVGSTYTGTATGTNAGTISFSGASNAASASLGTNGNSLGTVNISSGMIGTLANRVYATDVNLTGAGSTTFGGGITGNLNFSHASAIGELSNNATITGNVTTNAATNGELRFAGNGSVSGTVAVGTLRLDGLAGTTATINGAATINTLTLSSNGNLTFGAGGTITDAVSNATTGTIRNNGGTLTFTGGLTAANATLQVDGTGGVTVGAVSSVSSIVKTGAGDSTISGQIAAPTINISGGGKLTVSTPMSLIAGSAVTFQTTGGAIAGAGGGNITSVVGHSDLSGTGTVDSQVTNMSVTNNSTNNGIINVGNGASTLSGATLASGSTLQFAGASVGAVSGTGILTLNGANQTASSTIAATTLNLNGSGIKTLGGATNVTNLNVIGGVTTAGAGAITTTTFTKTNADANTATIGNNLTATTANIQNGTVTLNGASNSITTLNLGEAAQSRTVVFDGTGTPATITNVNHVGTGSSTYSNAVTATNIGVAGGSLTFSNANTATSAVTFTGAGALNLNNVTGTRSESVAFGTNNGTVNYGSGVTYTGSATNGGTGNGNLSFGNGATIGGAATIGSNANKLNSLTFAGGTNTINTAIHALKTNIGAGNVTSTNTTFDSGVHFTDNGVMTLAANTATIGAVTTAAAPGTAMGTLAFSGGPLTINGGLAQLQALSLANSTVAAPAAALTITGNAVAADVMTIGGANVTVGGTFETTATTALTFNVKTATVAGKITATAGAVTVNANTGVNMIVDTSDVIVHGQDFILIDGSAAGGNGVADLVAGKLTTTNTALLHFKQRTNIDHSLVVYADRTQMSTAVKEPNNAAVGKMLDALGAGGDADVDALQVRLGNFLNATDVEKMLATVTPDISGGTVAATTTVGNSSSTIVNNRITAARSGENFGTGVASGDWAEGGHFWGQAFGATADQGMRDRIAGYEADSYGMVLGMDGDVTDKFRAGLALTYGNTAVDGEDANNSQADIDSYQVGLYGDYDLGDSYFVSGQLAYMYSDIDTVRYNVGGLVGNTARANFNSDQYTARGEVGREFALDNTFSLTPSATANYNYIDIEDYTERGAGGLSLRDVKTDELQVLEFGVNLIAAAQFDDTIGGTIRPNVHAGYRYDVIGDNVATTGALAGGGAAFKTEGFEPAQSTINIGTGLTWETSSNLDLTLNYDYENKSDYDAHSGFVRAGYKF